MRLRLVRSALVGVALAALPCLGAPSFAVADTGVLLTLGAAPLTCQAGDAAHVTIDINPGASMAGGSVVGAVADVTYRASTGATSTQQVSFGPGTLSPPGVEIIPTVNAPAVSGTSIVGVTVTAEAAVNTTFLGAGCGSV